MNGATRILTQVVLAVAGLCWLAGCMPGRKAAATLGSSSMPVEEWVGEPVELSTVASVAILPFADDAAEQGFDPIVFSTRIANQLTARGRLRVLYPKQVIEGLEKENAKIQRHNLKRERRRILGQNQAVPEQNAVMRADARSGGPRLVDERDLVLEKLDPIRRAEDAVRLGRLLGVDAVMMGRVTDFDPYMRPRIGVTLEIVCTGTSDGAARALAELTQWGVPRRTSVAEGRVWFLQQNFDSRIGNIALDVYAHGMTRHVDENPYDTALYLRSITRYYEYVGAAIARTFLRAHGDAVRESEQRAMEKARKAGLNKEQVRRRVHDLVYRETRLPDADRVVQSRLLDRRNREWRPDVYAARHPAKTAKHAKQQEVQTKAPSPLPAPVYGPQVDF